MRIYLRCMALIVFVSFITLLVVKTQPVLAQSESSSSENIQVSQSLPETSTVTITGEAQLPNPYQRTILTGEGEPGAEATLKVMAGQKVLFQQSTSIDGQGQWMIVIPPLSESPTSLLITSTVQTTLSKVVETTTVTTLATASTLILIQLIAERILQTFQVFGLLGRKRTRGFVYDLATKKPIPFAELTIESVVHTGSKAGTKLLETVVSSVDGFFRTVDLPPGKYTLHVAHSAYNFPVKVAKPWYANPLQFYQGEPIDLSSQKLLEIVFVPMEAQEKGQVARFYWLNWRVFASVLFQLAKMLTLPMGIVSIVILFIYPSFINFVIASIYSVFGAEFLIRYYSNRALKGTVVDAKNQAVSNAVVRVFRTASKTQGQVEGLVAVTLSNNSGRFSLRVPPGKYQVIVNKEGLIATENQGMSFEVVDVTRSVTNLQYHLVPMQRA